jgi:hypothetical protein
VCRILVVALVGYRVESENRDRMYNNRATELAAAVISAAPNEFATSANATGSEMRNGKTPPYSDSTFPQRG